MTRQPFRENSYLTSAHAQYVCYFRDLPLILACQCCKGEIFYRSRQPLLNEKKPPYTQCLARTNRKFIVLVADVAFVARNRPVLVSHRQKNTKIFLLLALRSSKDPERVSSVTLAFCWSNVGRSYPKKTSDLGAM